MPQTLEERVQFLIRNNLGWDIDHHIPVEVLDKEANGWFGKIHFLKKSEDVIFPINDMKLEETFESKFAPKKIQLKKLALNASDFGLNNILLHELNHWYTYERYGGKVKPHGKEFKLCAMLNGIDYQFRGASFDLPALQIGMEPNPNIIATIKRPKRTKKQEPKYRLVNDEKSGKLVWEEYYDSKPSLIG